MFIGPKPSQTGLIMAAVTGTAVRRFCFGGGRLGPVDDAMSEGSWRNLATGGVRFFQIAVDFTGQRWCWSFRCNRGCIEWTKMIVLEYWDLNVECGIAVKGYIGIWNSDKSANVGLNKCVNHGKPIIWHETNHLVIHWGYRYVVDVTNMIPA